MLFIHLEKMLRPLQVLGLVALLCAVWGLGESSWAGESHMANAKDAPDLELATLQFEEVSRRLMSQIQESRTPSQNQPKLSKENDRFIASYIDIEPDTLRISVEKTDTVMTPFVGTMRYLESHYISRGRNRTKAIQGRYRKAKRVQVTEIFLYHNGTWMR